jgi:hypothetical protein
MKQRVTADQIGELTTEQFKRLSLPVSEAHISEFDRLKDIGIAADWVSKQITIGKMIEILQDKIAYFGMHNMFARIDSKQCHWWGVQKPKNFDIRAEELCDALWEAVKKILSEDV